MLMDEKTQDLSKTALSLNADLTAENLAKFSTVSAPESLFKRATRKVPLWMQALVPFVCVGIAVVLLGVTTQNWIVAGITGAAAFISLSAFFAVAAYHRIRGQDMLKKDLLIAAVEAKVSPVAITDLQGALVCANSAYGRLLDGFPSPGSLPVTDEDRAAIVEASRTARVCGRGSARIERPSRDNAQPLDVTVRRSKQIENYLVWDIEGAGREAQIQKFLDLSEGGLAHWLGAIDTAFLMTDAAGQLRYASPLLRGWLGELKRPISAYALQDFLSSPAGHASLLAEDGTALFEVDVTARDLRAGDADDEHAGVVYIVRKDIAQAARPGQTSDIAQAVFNDAPVGMAVVETGGDFLRRNRSLQKLFNSAKATDSDNLLELVDETDRETLLAYMQSTSLEASADRGVEVRLKSKEDIVAHVNKHVLPDAKNEILLFISDATEQKSLERQFAQAQKMQAVGQLAGGIAHDFNNILTAIIGFCDLLLVRHSAGDPSFADIMQIKQNANRAANLVRQLLAFSRQQTLMPKILGMTDVLAELSNLIRRLIGENITLKMVHGRDLEPIKVDQGQLEQVIVNLAVNARDAMPNGGNLTISTSMASAEDVAKMGHDFMPSKNYVRLHVRDTGHGIEKDILNKIFEPFFTTKETGKGTGLGLSTVYGIVKQTGGFIFADSEPGQGAAFIIYLPAHAMTKEESIALEKPPEVTAPVADYWGKGTILLVEDEDAVRTFASRALSKKGYHVVAAASGQEALELLEDDLEVDLLISDVVMPQMDGPTLVKTVRETRPTLQVIFISGYAQDGFGVAEGLEQIDFLPKPFSLSQLAEAVKIAMPVTTETESQ